MKYEVRTTKEFDKEIKKLDNYTKLMIVSWIRENLVDCENPREKGKALKGNLRGEWRYRIGDYRLICEIKDNELIILALRIGHRREIYK